MVSLVQSRRRSRHDGLCFAPRTLRPKAVFRLAWPASELRGASRDIANLGDNSPSKTVRRMRDDGVLNADAFDLRGFRMAPNASGQGEHKGYLWTNKLPAGLERRNTPRGCK